MVLKANAVDETLSVPPQLLYRYALDPLHNPCSCSLVDTRHFIPDRVSCGQRK